MPEEDRAILLALSHFPDSRHSAVLAGWLRAGWRSSMGSLQPVRCVAPPPASAVPLQPRGCGGAESVPSALRPLVRRVFVDAAIDPSLAEFLAGLPRHERGREIRHLIERALRIAASSSRATAQPLRQPMPQGG